MIRFLVHFSTDGVRIEIEAGSSEPLPMTMCFLAWFGVLQGHAQKQHFGTSMATNVVGNSIESPTWRHLVMGTSCSFLFIWRSHMKYFLTYYMVGCKKNWKKSACRSSKSQGAQWSGGCPRCPGNDLQKKIRVEHAFPDSQPWCVETYWYNQI